MVSASADASGLWPAGRLQAVMIMIKNVDNNKGNFFFDIFHSPFQFDYDTFLLQVMFLNYFHITPSTLQWTRSLLYAWDRSLRRLAMLFIHMDVKPDMRNSQHFSFEQTRFDIFEEGI